MFRRFWQAREAGAALTFGLMAIPVMLISGAAIDLNLVYSDRGRGQDALDRATLAAAVDLGLISDVALEQNLRTNFAAFYKPTGGTTTRIVSVTVDTKNGSVNAVGETVTPTMFLGMAGFDQMTATLISTVKQGINDYDVALVLDTTGSMAGSKISTLQTAAKDLVHTLLAMNTTTTRNDLVQIGVVPFAATVNVGAGFGPTYSGTTRTSAGTGAAWLDVNGLSSIHKQNFNTGLTDNRFALFAALAAARPAYASVLNWAGCVEARPAPYDVKDTPPASGTPDTLYVPSFAPDEPGYRTTSGTSASWVTSSSFTNNYLDDNGGQCTANSASLSNTTTRLEAQGRTCKYKGVTTSQWRSTPTLALGPNASCTSKPILAMTRDETTIAATIDSLTASGNTNIHEGVMWGWHVLSPAEPFTQGRTPTAGRPLRRIMIVMTDGENTYTTSSNMNQSTYASYGYIAKNRLGISTGDAVLVKQKQDEKTAAACANAKADDGIIIYTIGFTVTAQDTLDLLKGCATSPQHFYQADDNATLLAVFKAIAKDITQLRISL